MSKQYHILNGDALKKHFPESIHGELIIMRECLVDGSVQGKQLSDFYNTRAQFISTSYEGFNEQDYFTKAVTEFEKMQAIPDGAEINLWFEDDLFCQVNFWFVINLLKAAHPNTHYYLIRPNTLQPRGFCGLPKSTLTELYADKLLLTELDQIASLWNAYQMNEINALVNIANELNHRYPFIANAVNAHIERIPTENNLGRPSQSLLQIIEELQTNKFEPVFAAFNKRESIYGFGDLQVKRILDELTHKGLIVNRV